MPVPLDWNARNAVAACPIVPWHGLVWRSHRRIRAAMDPRGSVIVSGRYHRGQDLFAPDQAWRALYTALGRDVSLAEAVRSTEAATIDRLNDLRITELTASLSAVLDCRDPTIMGLTIDDLCHDRDWDVTQEIGAAALGRGVEGVLVPSATRLGDNLILFPDQFRETTRIREVGSVDPKLRRG